MVVAGVALVLVIAALAIIAVLSNTRPPIEPSGPPLWGVVK